MLRNKFNWDGKGPQAAGPDGYPGEVFKYAGLTVIESLHSSSSLFWTSEHIPKFWETPIITMIYKRKERKSLCLNYRSISLHGVAGKVLARVLLSRLIDSPIMDILPEIQCGFLKDRCTPVIILVARQLQEKSREQHQTRFLTFVDLTKAFDTVNCNLIWSVLAMSHCRSKARLCTCACNT